MAKVLLVDDDEDVRAVLSAALKGWGHQILTADDGAKVMDLFREHRPDLVIMDLVMPGEDGIKSIVRLRKEIGDVKIIAISGGSLHSGNLYLPMAKKLGAKRTLNKPFDMAELRQAVDDVLNP